jgi:hypothetical protein
VLCAANLSFFWCENKPIAFGKERKCPMRATVGIKRMKEREMKRERARKRERESEREQKRA